MGLVEIISNYKLTNTATSYRTISGLPAIRIGYGPIYVLYSYQMGDETTLNIRFRGSDQDVDSPSFFYQPFGPRGVGGFNPVVTNSDGSSIGHFRMAYSERKDSAGERFGAFPSEIVRLEVLVRGALAGAGAGTLLSLKVGFPDPPPRSGV